MSLRSVCINFATANIAQSYTLPRNAHLVGFYASGSAVLSTDPDLTQAGLTATDQVTDRSVFFNVAGATMPDALDIPLSAGTVLYVANGSTASVKTMIFLRD